MWINCQWTVILVGMATPRPAMTPRGRGRPRTGTSDLSRQSVLDAALAVIDEDGVDAVSMRTVARRLGVDAKSLYNHVAGKDALLDGVADAIVSSTRIPRPTGDLRADLLALALAFRDATLAHPRAAGVVLTRPVESLSTVAPLEAVLSIVMAAGATPASAVHLLRTIMAFITGTLLREAGAGQTFAAGPDGDPEVRRRALEASGSPAVAAAAPHLAVCDHEYELRFGLTTLIDAFASELEG